MTATVFRMGDHRAVFLMPDPAGTVVFLASRGPSPRIGHEQVFAADDEASGYAAALSLKYECPTIGAAGADRGEDVA